MSRFLLFFLILVFKYFLCADDLLVLKGFLGHEELRAAFEKIETFKETNHDRIIIELNSSSGDLQEVFHFSEVLFELKKKRQKTLVVYIEGKAVGPAAIFPFLADDLITTPLVAWGDIPYRSEGDINWQRLRFLLKKMIGREGKDKALLSQLVDAMTDPFYQLIYEKQPPKKEEGNSFGPLILNRRKMEAFGVVSSVLSDEAFARDFLQGEKQKQPFYPGIVSNYVSQENLDKKLKNHLHYSETEKNLIGYLTIGPHRAIDQSTYLYVKFAMESFKKQEVRFVVLHLNTPGGEVFSTLKIVDLLQKSDLAHGIPIIAYLDDWAVSAGAMLAYSCRFIAINPGSIMGAAEPVLQAEGKMESAPEKINSALRAQFANLANFYGRNPYLAEAMVDKDIILVIRNHEIIKLSSEEEIHRGGHNPDLILSKKGKLLTLKAEELRDLGVADFSISASDAAQIEGPFDQETWKADKMPLFKNAYLSKIPKAFMISYKDWRISFFSFLSHPAMMGLLLMGLIIGFYIEINTPGFGIMGSLGLACLALILLSSFSVEAINWIEIIILVLGLALFAIELFFIPGFGVIGILGIILTIIGLFALMLPGLDKVNLFDVESLNLIGIFFLKRLAFLSGALIVSLVVIVLLAKFCSKRFFRFSKLVLHGEQEGFVSGIPKELMPQEGELGETLTPLSPSGKVHIGDRLYDAMAQTGYLEEHIAIEVVRVEGSKLIVRKVDLKGK